MLRDYRADLHIHSCLSPCGDWEMSPKKIVRQSLARGLDIIAVCDHNSIENAGAILQEGRRSGLHVLPGMEICSREEVHILAIFDRLAAAESMQQFVYDRLPGENRPAVFGHQVVADANDDVVEENQRLLIGASRLGLYEVVRQTHALGGLSVTSHVDRQAFSIIGQLGFIPEDLAIDGIEISRRLTHRDACEKFPGIERFACVRSSDAHYLKDIGIVSTVLRLAAPTVDEIRLALKAEHGRKIVT